MSESADKRAQPWQKWYAPLIGGVTAERHLTLSQNSGNDNKNRNVFATCSPSTAAAKQQIEAQLAAKKKDHAQGTRSSASLEADMGW